jgi:hypothetical protein
VNRFFDSYSDQDENDDHFSYRPICRRCGCDEVRWRLQGDKWTLFSLQPGVLHQCPVEDVFGVVAE